MASQRQIHLGKLSKIEDNFAQVGITVDELMITFDADNYSDINDNLQKIQQGNELLYQLVSETKALI